MIKAALAACLMALGAVAWNVAYTWGQVDVRRHTVVRPVTNAIIFGECFTNAGTMYCALDSRDNRRDR